MAKPKVSLSRNQLFTIIGVGIVLYIIMIAYLATFYEVERKIEIVYDNEWSAEITYKDKIDGSEIVKEFNGTGGRTIELDDYASIVITKSNSLDTSELELNGYMKAFQTWKEVVTKSITNETVLTLEF